MSMVRAVARMWVKPMDTARRVIGNTHEERRALITLMTACFIIFFGTFPEMQRVQIETGQALSDQLPGAFILCMIWLPLIFYVIAGLVGFLARAFGWKGTGVQARMALFWAFLAASPMFLFYGLLRGFVGESVGTTFIGSVWFVAFLSFWFIDLWKGVSADV